MSKELPSLTPKHLVRVLEKIGFEFFRQKGSHRVFVNGTGRSLSHITARTLKKALYTRLSRGPY